MMPYVSVPPLAESLLDPARAFGTPAVAEFLAEARPSPSATADPRDGSAGEELPANPTRRVRDAADALHTSQDWSTLARLYEALAEQAWLAAHHAVGLRLLLAARAAADRAGDDARVSDITGFLALRHRVRAGFVAAEFWNRVLLAGELTAATAALHVRAWRELAALREVAADYTDGIACCQRSEDICAAYPAVKGVVEANVQTLLQRAVLERQRGRFDAAVSATNAARELADAAEVGPMVRGLVALRAGGLDLVVGRADTALASFQLAQRYFTGRSAHNASLARLRQIAPLRGLRRYDEALILVGELLDEPGTDRYRRGQLLLERAEVQQEMGDVAAVRASLEEARPLYEHAESLEAVRWHRHLARLLLTSGEDPDAARQHLRAALTLTIAPGRRDLTRALLILHDLLRVPAPAALPPHLQMVAGRAALAATDLQRDSLREPEARWAAHAQREEVYAGAILLHDAYGRGEDITQIIETGRADLLNQVIAASARPSAAVLTALPLVPAADPSLLDGVFEAAEDVVRHFTGGAQGTELLPLPGALPSDAELDQLGDVVVQVQLVDSAHGWCCAVCVRERAGRWQATVRPVPDEISGLVERLAGGGLLPDRGLDHRAWESLSAALLPGGAAWRGRPDRPRSIVLCPDPRLWQVPYAALPRDGRYLADVAETTLTPSLRTQCLLRARADRNGLPGTSPRGERAAVGLLDSSLPGHLVEKRSLAAWPGGLRLIDRLPLPGGGQLENVLADVDLLYVSGRGHGPGLSGMRASDVSIDDLWALELPSLVVLNGCWSATAASRFGRDPLSLAVGALVGGADTVLAGIGLIGEHAAALVAAGALAHLRRGMSPRAALRRAQLDVRDEHVELGPYEWAGICVVGTGD